jgi:hypothetical protein
LYGQPSGKSLEGISEQECGVIDVAVHVTVSFTANEVDKKTVKKA